MIEISEPNSLSATCVQQPIMNAKGFYPYLSFNPYQHSLSPTFLETVQMFSTSYRNMLSLIRKGYRHFTSPVSTFVIAGFMRLSKDNQKMFEWGIEPRPRQVHLDGNWAFD